VTRCAIDAPTAIRIVRELADAVRELVATALFDMLLAC
jgi:hypothetical protein